ncbi:uncharacterized protein EV420DRAFT_37983 [Desarmillaria tabescens]|uniref:Uncharacterized protein n=1 Tax=Armillaria tabescens TaxID=1929756 RepID=A0AA39NPQ9_ARMTA|nr:uncharacterized protein EV420DRAFT_37983 [Desarmillaria tabescens]KAK0469506.1 hypothetical protein EV420DRAFT_37983 [Desarmillaria tabescens]
MLGARLQFLYSLILPRPPFEIPPSHHDPIRHIRNSRRHTLSTHPSKISWDSAQDYDAGQTLTRPTSPYTPAKIARHRRNSATDTPRSTVSKKSRRATTCCCSCHCPYTTPKCSVDSELNMIQAAPTLDLPYVEDNDIFGPTLEMPPHILRKRKSKLPSRPASEYSFPRIYSKDHFYQHSRRHSGDSFGSVKVHRPLTKCLNAQTKAYSSAN